MSKTEYVSPEGLRLDGRRPMEMRQLRAEIGTVAKANGSAVFEMGNTKVIAAVYGPREFSCWFVVDDECNSVFQVQNRSQQLNDQALAVNGDITCHPPDHGGVHFDSSNASFSGTRSACINAATLALADAGIPMRDIVTSCSAGYLNSTPLLDLNYIEDSAGGPDVTVGILPKLDKVTLLQMEAKLPVDIFENVMGLAVEGCKAVANYIKEMLWKDEDDALLKQALALSMNIPGSDSSVGDAEMSEATNDQELAMGMSCYLFVVLTYLEFLCHMDGLHNCGSHVGLKFYYLAKSYQSSITKELNMLALQMFMLNGSIDQSEESDVSKVLGDQSFMPSIISSELTQM
ncbi:3'-5'-exoribonuclease family protein isoform 2 [Hibiscus syriacus]|uniref:3'-5'-exoribonuclease family protein isoform 2 n=1 Tax=Hibiscus syriacus TaxID=106335 RepID=A0A6A3BLB5_HIBSY|nr:3'-5'-exoribonuclease family protein isoform 2 [Hibiscus syriacus]